MACPRDQGTGFLEALAATLSVRENDGGICESEGE